MVARGKKKWLPENAVSRLRPQLYCRTSLPTFLLSPFFLNVFCVAMFTKKDAHSKKKIKKK